MKKYITLGLGFFMAFSALVISSQAGSPSRYWRSTYRSQSACTLCVRQSMDSKQRYVRGGCCDKGRVRTFSDRIGPFKHRKLTRRELNTRTFDFSHASQRHDVWYHPQYRKTQVAHQARVTLNRERHPNLFPRQANVNGTRRNAVRNSDYRDRTLNVQVGVPKIAIYQKNLEPTRLTPSMNKVPRTQFFGKRYSLEVPAGFVQKSTGHYESKDSSLAFRVIKTPEKYSCVQQSFEQCAIDLGKGFKDGQNLVQVTQMKRDSYWDQTIGDEFLYYPTLTESFHANGFGNSNVYIIFNALDPENGSVVRIEAVARTFDTDDASKTMKRIFQSFRFHL